MSQRSQTQLFLIGLGIMIPGHVTFQAGQAMLLCSKLYSVIQEPPQLWLPQDILGRVHVINVMKWYVEDELRMQNYDRVASRIFSGVSRGQSIGYVTYGNPMAYDRVAQNLVQLAKHTGCPVQVVPGISSVDGVLCDLRLDMAPGIQVFDASWLVACQIRPRVDVPLLLMQVGAFGSLRTHYTHRRDGRSLSDLVQYCGKFYPKSHPVTLVRSSCDTTQPALVRQVAIEDLVTVTADDLSGATLYIPASEESLPDEKIVSSMEQT